MLIILSGKPLHKLSALVAKGFIPISSLNFISGCLMCVCVCVCLCGNRPSVPSPPAWCLQPEIICRWQSHHSQHSSVLLLYTQVKLFSHKTGSLLCPGDLTCFICCSFSLSFQMQVTRNIHSDPGEVHQCLIWTFCHCNWSFYGFIP